MPWHKQYEALYQVNTPYPLSEQSKMLREAEAATLAWLTKIALEDGYLVMSETVVLSTRIIEGVPLIKVVADVKQANHERKKAHDRKRARQRTVARPAAGSD